jgi:hypothetical protein
MEEDPDTTQSKIEDTPVHPFAEFLPEMNPADFPPIHTLAKEFPMLSAQELQEVAEDIKVRGLLAPILTYQGAILDGRNRWVACRMAGVEPTTIEYTEADPVGSIRSFNILRRHLTTAERARLAELLATASHGGDHSGSESTLANTAKELDVSRTSVATVRKIKKKSPKAYNDLKRGKHKSVNAAAKAAGLTKSKGSKAFRSADKAAEIEPVQSENNIVQRLNAGEIPAEVTAEVHFWHFEKLKTFGEETADTAKIEPIIEALWSGVASRFQKGVREIFPRYLTVNAYGKPRAQTSELFKPNSLDAEKAQKHVKETFIRSLEVYLKKADDKFGSVHVCEIHQMMNEEYRRFAESDPRTFPFKSKDSKPEESKPDAESKG